jgi:hypothetical protein
MNRITCIFITLLTIFISSHSISQEGEVGVIFRDLDASQTQADSPELAMFTSLATSRPIKSFSWKPVVTSSTHYGNGRGQPSNTRKIFWACINLQTGYRHPNSAFTITEHEYTPNSGGHNHDDANRPTGSWYPLSGNSGSDGWWETSYDPSEIGGEETFRLHCQPPNLSGSSAVWTIFLEFPNLMPLTTGTNYELVGSTSTHFDSHYGEKATLNAIENLANDMASRYPGLKLRINDMSLEYGGLFDLPADWTRRSTDKTKNGHGSHRFGIDVDISKTNLSAAMVSTFHNRVYANGFLWGYESGHLHFRMP